MTTTIQAVHHQAHWKRQARLKVNHLMSWSNKQEISQCAPKCHILKMQRAGARFRIMRRINALGSCFKVFYRFKYFKNIFKEFTITCALTAARAQVMAAVFAWVKLPIQIVNPIFTWSG